jgi:hypothetical protein
LSCALSAPGFSGAPPALPRHWTEAAGRLVSERYPPSRGPDRPLRHRASYARRLPAP